MPSKQQQQQQAPPKRKRRGKELLLSALDGESATGASSSIGNTGKDDQQLDAVIAELEKESERRAKKMRRAMDDMKQRFLNAFQIELLKIPRRVRGMKLGTFLEEFGGSEALKRSVSSEGTATTATAAQTPRAPPSHASLLHSRLPRAGEAIMSLNGSPLAAVPLSSTGKLAATVKMKHHQRSRLPGKHKNADDDASAARDTQLLVETTDGVVSLSEPETLKALADAPDVKSSMLSQLSALQADIANVMKSLQ